MTEIDEMVAAASARAYLRDADDSLEAAIEVLERWEQRPPGLLADANDARLALEAVLYATRRLRIDRRQA
jgi:hypothetical protein